MGFFSSVASVIGNNIKVAENSDNKLSDFEKN